MFLFTNIKAWVKRTVYLVKKVIASQNTEVVIYTKNHPIYTSTFEGDGIKGYTSVYADLSSRLNLLERYLHDKAKLVHADAATMPCNTPKKLVVECEGKPDKMLLDDKRVIKVFVESKWALRKLGAAACEHFSVLYPSINVQDYRKISVSRDKPITLLAVGHGGMLKGYDVVVDIFKTLREEYNVRLIIAGSLGHNFEFYPEIGESAYAKKKFNEMYTHLAMDKNVRISPVRREVLLSEVYPSADIYLHFSRLETFGYSILEAMSFGLPVVASNLHAIPEMVVHGETGFLVNDFSDDINSDEWYKKSYDEGLAAISKLIDDTELRQRFSQNAIRRVEDNFNIANKKATLKVLFDGIN